MNNPASSTIRAYYDSLESRLGYRLFLGGTRHLGYYESETSRPWPISTALRTMESKLLEALECPRGAEVLDAGCGHGHVALYVAKHGGFRIQGIDLTPHHVMRAEQNVQREEMNEHISIRLLDYHDLGAFGDATFDGIYTMETFVHSSNPRKVLEEFFRILKPGGSLVMHEYDHARLEEFPRSIADRAEVLEAKMLVRNVGLPALEAFETDYLPALVRDVGYEEVHVTDMSKHIVPMLRLFNVCACVPYHFLKLFGLERRFPNTVAGVVWYKCRNYWRYVQVKAKKSS